MFEDAPEKKYKKSLNLCKFYVFYRRCDCIMRLFMCDVTRTMTMLRWFLSVWQLDVKIFLFCFQIIKFLCAIIKFKSLYCRLKINSKFRHRVLIIFIAKIRKGKCVSALYLRWFWVIKIVIVRSRELSLLTKPAGIE